MKVFFLLLLSSFTGAAQPVGEKWKEKYESLTPSGSYFLAGKRMNPITVRRGVLDKNGKVCIPFQYDGIEIMGEHALVFVIKNRRYEMGLVSLSNRTIIPVSYSHLEAAHQCYVVKDRRNTFGVFSKDGTCLTGLELDSVRVCGPYILLYKEKQVGLMSGAGKMLLPIEYSTIEVGQNIKMQKPPSWFSISTNGQKRLGIEADDVIPADKSYIIRVGNKWGVCDSTRQILPLKYTDIKSCGKNFMVKTKMGWSFFDKASGRFQNKNYDSVILRDPSIVFTNFWGMLDEKGNEILPCMYDSIGERRGENILVKMRSGYGIVSFSDQWIESPKRSVKWINNELYTCSDEKTTWVKDVRGRIIHAAENHITPFAGYFREVNAKGKQTDFDFNGQVLRTSGAANKWLGAFSEDLQGVCNDRRFGFINKNNQLVIGNRYEDVKSFSEGLAAVKVRYWGFINTDDKFVVQPAYDTVGHFQNHLCIVSRNRKWGIVNDKGVEVLALGYDKIIRSENGFLLINKQKMGLANKQGEVVIDPRFDSLQPVSTLCIAGQNKKFGVISDTGISLTPIIYDKVIYNPFQKVFLARKEGERTEMELFK